MRQSIALLSVVAGMALAESDGVQFFFPGGYDGVAPVASVVEANPSTTVLQLSCPTGIDSTECGWGPGIEYSIISTTQYEATMTGDGYAMNFACDHNSKKTEMSCDVTVSGADYTEYSGGVFATNSVLTGSEVGFITASVTAGAAKLAAETGAASAASSGSGFATSAKATGSGSAAAASQPTASGASATGSGVPAQSTGAASRYGLEGSALLALAGAAALNMW